MNSEFAAFMTNHMTWGMDAAESFLEVDVKLNITLEVVLILMKQILANCYLFYPYTVTFFIDT